MSRFLGDNLRFMQPRDGNVCTKCWCKHAGDTPSNRRDPLGNFLQTPHEMSDRFTVWFFNEYGRVPKVEDLRIDCKNSILEAAIAGMSKCN